MRSHYPPYNANLRARSEDLEQECIDHPHEIAARSLDGTQTLAIAKTRSELRGILSQEGIDRSSVVFAYIPSHDENEIFSMN